MPQTVSHWLRAAAFGAALAANPAQASVDSHASAEAKLQRMLELLRDGKRDEALREINRLLERHPNFRLAHLSELRVELKPRASDPGTRRRTAT